MTITVPAGTTLTLRCPGEPAVALVALSSVSANFVAELPPLPVLSLDGPGTRRIGVLELVSSAGVTWIEAELKDGLLSVVGDTPTGMWQRRETPRRPGTYPAIGTVQIEAEPGRRLVAVSGHVEDISTGGLLLRASAPDSPHLPPGVLRALLHVTMPWGDMTAALAPVSQRSDHLRGTYEWLDPADAAALRDFCAPDRR